MQCWPLPGPSPVAKGPRWRFLNMGTFISERLHLVWISRGHTSRHRPPACLTCWEFEGLSPFFLEALGAPSRDPLQALFEPSKRIQSVERRRTLKGQGKLDESLLLNSSTLGIRILNDLKAVSDPTGNNNEHQSLNQSYVKVVPETHALLTQIDFTIHFQSNIGNGRDSVAARSEWSQIASVPCGFLLQ